MIKIEILRCQHETALALAHRLLELVEDHQPGASTYPILMQFNRLFGIMRVHLAHEDVELYPMLMASMDPRAAHTAQLYVDEMGDLAGNLEGFARHWSCSASIASRFDEFREAVHELILALAIRIEREDQYLYPLVEAEAKVRRHAA
jgi:hemerythrin-like domain-containing protein